MVWEEFFVAKCLEHEIMKNDRSWINKSEKKTNKNQSSNKSRVVAKKNKDSNQNL